MSHAPHAAQEQRTPTRWKAGWEAVTATATAALVLTGMFALVFAYLQINEARDEARVQHLVQLVRDFDQPPMVDYRKKLAAKRIDSVKEQLRSLDVDDPPGEMYDLLNFFEEVGMLAKRGYLDKKDVWDSFGYWMFNLYADARPLIEEEQKSDPATYVDLANLMTDMVTIDSQQHSTRAHPNAKDVYAFYQNEMESRTGRALPTHPKRKK
ncbi:MAG: hypothetical protein LAO06_05965 [Acidobacteriia bacterium]|nr:hypothetical protein [Terriglobia bacterium]